MATEVAAAAAAPNNTIDDDTEMTEAAAGGATTTTTTATTEINKTSAEEEEEDLYPSLIIPITSSNNSSNLFVEIFPEELPDIASSTILQVLKDEDAELNTWADAALLYMQQNQSRESSTILQAACDHPDGNAQQKVRVLASAGIALLTQAQASQSTGAGGGGGGAGGGGGGTGGNGSTEFRSMADDRFTHASKVDTLFPMTWIGRGMLNLSLTRLDQARFFFDTTLKHCGAVLPALLGMAAVLYGRRRSGRGGRGRRSSGESDRSWWKCKITVKRRIVG